MDITPYVAPIITAIITGAGTYAAIASRITRLETKMDDLNDSVHRHNGVVERTAVAERDLKTAWNAIEDLRAEMREIKHELHGYKSGAMK